MAKASDRVVFATRPYAPLADALSRLTGIALGKIDIGDYPDGERHVRILEPLVGKSAIVVGGTIDDAATLELYDIASGLALGGVNQLQIVIPYFGYSTQERAVRDGDVVLAKARAVLLSSVPVARLNNEIYLLDLHTPGIAHYFEGGVSCKHLSAHTIVLDIVRDVTKRHGEPVIACTDAGRAKWVESLANEAGLTAAFVFKKRDLGGKTTVRGINVDVKGRPVVLYDDMTRSGKSLIQAAEAYKAAGASSITGIVTHGVFYPDTLAKLKASGLFESFHATDSHPRAVHAEKASDGFLKVHSVAPILANGVA